MSPRKLLKINSVMRVFPKDKMFMSFVFLNIWMEKICSNQENLSKNEKPTEGEKLSLASQNNFILRKNTLTVKGEIILAN